MHKMNLPGDGYCEERLTDGVRFVLPARQLAKARHGGWVVCAVGVFGLALVAASISVPIAAGFAAAPRDPLFKACVLGFACLGLVGSLQLIKLFCLGVAIVLNRTFTEVVVRNGRLLCSERFFFFRFVRRCKVAVDRLQEFTVQTARLPSSHASDEQLMTWYGDATSLLSVNWGEESTQRFTIVGGYPDSILQRLTADLQASLRHVKIGTASPSPPDWPPAGEEAMDEPEMACPSVTIQPSGSDAVIERRADGMSLFIPPAGILRGSKGLFVFALVWNLLIGGFLGMFTLSAFGFVKGLHHAMWFGYLFLLPFVGIGVATMLAALNMGRRTTAIATCGDELFVVRKGLFGKKTQRWALSEVRIRVAHSGMKVNDQPLQELQIHSTRGKFGMLCERPEVELHWIASQLKEVARCDASAANSAT